MIHNKECEADPHCPKPNIDGAKCPQYHMFAKDIKYDKARGSKFILFEVEIFSISLKNGKLYLYFLLLSDTRSFKASEP